MINKNNIIQNQPTINIGMIGSVSNGKSSLTEQITKTKTQRHSTEKQRNITIKLGYANAKIYKCHACEAPKCYQSTPSDIMIACCEYCNLEMELVRHVSFIDCPGHNLLMSTMLNGTCVMDSTILVESISNKTIPARQTEEHIKAANILGLKNAIVCMNKCDLSKKQITLKKIEELDKFLKLSIAKNTPIVPIVANYGINKDVVCEYICTRINDTQKDLQSEVKMIIIRSFNVNKHSTKIHDMKGGVIGGTIMKGTLHIGDRIKILPGIINKGEKKKWLCTPLISQVQSINSEKNNLLRAIPGGLIGVQLTIDPCFTAQDRLVGNIMQAVSNNEKNKVYEKLIVYPDMLCDDYNFMKNKGDCLVINHNACDIKCKILSCKKKQKILIVEFELIDRPICTHIGSYIAISRIMGQSNIKLIGRGEIKDGIESEMEA
jgi:translation initiation factor 2 subunit 3